MPELVADTHAMAVAGAASAAAGEAVISGAPIVLPAGGPYTIFKFWCTHAPATLTPAEQLGDYFRLNAASGDLTPNPQPSRFPVGQLGSFLGATADVGVMPTVMHEVNFEAAGKASLELIYNTPVIRTVAEQVVLGIIFGKTRPVMKPLQFVDRVRAQVAAAALTAVGTITISEKASKIVSVAGCLAQDNVLTTAQELLGFFSLASDDVKLPPAQYPFSCGYGAGLGALINNGPMVPPMWIPVEIPVEGGARIDCSVDLNTAVTNAAEVQIFIAFE